MNWWDAQILQGDCRDTLRTLPEASVHCCVTSPPYFGLRDYGHADQIGLEASPRDYVDGMVSVFREVRRVMRDDGTLWLNLGDSYSGSGRGGYAGGKGTLQGSTEGQDGSRKAREVSPAQRKNCPTVKGDRGRAKELLGIPWRVAFALQDDGWCLRQDIIWHKPNPMPESVQDRCTKAHEYLFLLSKSPSYYFDSQAMQEPVVYPKDPGNLATARAVPGLADHNNRSGLHRVGARDTRNRRSVWTVATRPYKGAHFATFPPQLIEPCVLAGCPEGGTVLDPFNGSGTTGQVALTHGRRYVGCETNPDYIDLTWKRLTA